MNEPFSSPQRVWRLYEAGKAYKTGIGLYDTVTKNERFFAGDQWAGVNAPDLPKPVLNFIKRACQQRVAEVRANPVKVCFEAFEFPKETVMGSTPDRLDDDGVRLLNAMFEADWEAMKLDSLTLDGLLDACVSGDCILYSYWDDEAETGQTVRGSIRCELIDNVNFYPDNPNERDLQKQPGLVIARRERVAAVISQMRANGRPAPELELVMPDSDCLYQSGDLAAHKLEDAENGKCITLMYLFKDANGHVMAQKSTREALIRPLWDTGLSHYPLAMMNWENRKNCCHGRAEITGLIPVQRYINQMYAMAMLFTMQSACPKPVFNQGMVKAWSNAIGAAIPVNGDVEAAVKYLEPPKLPSDIYDLPERLMRTTLEMTGVSDLALGKVNPTNTSALVLAREASTLPIETVKARFYAMIEEFASNWLDMLTAFSTVPRYVRLKGGKTALYQRSGWA